jgi:hypothetical protein
MADAMTGGGLPAARSQPPVHRAGAQSPAAQLHVATM